MRWFTSLSLYRVTTASKGQMCTSMRSSGAVSTLNRPNPKISGDTTHTCCSRRASSTTHMPVFGRNISFLFIPAGAWEAAGWLALGASVVLNIGLLVVLFRRRRFYYIAELNLKFPWPELKITPELDANMKALLNENVALKAQLKLYEQNSKLRRYEVVILLLIAAGLAYYYSWRKRWLHQAPDEPPASGEE